MDSDLKILMHIDLARSRYEKARENLHKCIRLASVAGVPQRRLAERAGLARNTVAKIAKGK